MANYVYSAGMVIAAVIHLLPLMGAGGAGRLASLYAVALDDPNLIVLLRHRAVLSGLLGAGLLWAAFHPEYGAVALAAAAISVVSFLWFAQAAGGLNAALRVVVMADWIALAALAVAFVGYLMRD